METIITTIDKEKAWEIRHKVMWPDKDFDYIKVKDDDVGIHFGLLEQDKLISVNSLFINNKEAQFRKFATLGHDQGQGSGRRLLDYVIKDAQDRTLENLWCNARQNKIGFYKKFGLQETNVTFTKGGKSYVIMEKDLINKGEK